MLGISGFVQYSFIVYYSFKKVTNMVNCFSTKLCTVKLDNIVHFQFLQVGCPQEIETFDFRF